MLLSYQTKIFTLTRFSAEPFEGFSGKLTYAVYAIPLLWISKPLTVLSKTTDSIIFGSLGRLGAYSTKAALFIVLDNRAEYVSAARIDSRL